MAFDVRALEYAACTWALQQDSRVPGSEATFEQALTNALAAIVSRDFPDELRGDRGIKSATRLLDVLEAKVAPGESPGVVRLPHDPRAGITWTTFDGIPGLDDPYPNFTTLYGVWGGTEQNLALRASPASDLGRRLSLARGRRRAFTDQMSSSSAALGSRSGRSSTGRVNG
jgi:hypothetical protein